MTDYIKFKSKPDEEMLNILEGQDNIFLLNCGKCYKEFTGDEELECVCAEDLLVKSGKKVAGYLSVDFLCNGHFLEKIINSNEKLKNASAIAVISCGVGIQTTTELTDRPVFGLADSVDKGSYHGMSLAPEKCDACGDCVLFYTNGICPITNCTKGLFNGPCGGAKSGKCEIGKTKDCGWEKIYNRAKDLGRLDMLGELFKMRNESKPDYETKKTYSVSVRQKRAQGFYGGIYPLEKKYITEKLEIKTGPEPVKVVIPLQQHIGSICDPIVKFGDRVKVGQKIGESKGFVSAPVHSSISGKVLSVEPRLTPFIKDKIMSVVIENDGKNELCETVKPNDKPENLSRDEIKDIIYNAGIVGLGGAQFPTHVKLNPPDGKNIDVFILNGCECEPYITCDDRLMIERPKDIMLGMGLLMKALGVKKGIIAIEENKPAAIESMKGFCDGENVKVVPLKTKYPQGAERTLIKILLNREVPRGGLPPDVGVVVNNIATAYAVSEIVNKGLPLVKRIITVTGEKIKNPSNLEVKIGASIKEIIDFCGGITEGNDVQLKIGGPMMGFVQETMDVPVVKGVNAILLTRPDIIEFSLANPCIKCGRCVDACPMELHPLYFGLFAQKDNFDEMAKYNVMDCIECACCDYVCPAKRPLKESAQKGKRKLLVKK
ncbi:MAG: Electron transport complex subunit RnfC [Syntrophomonadaceae bacterium]|nr:Electron transport complex subunit RnfC [Bacillota bacterium]